MAIDPTSLASGIVSNIITERAKAPVDDALDETLGTKPIKSDSQYLHDIHSLLVELLVWVKKANKGDSYNFIQIYQATAGPPFIPVHTSNRRHFELFAGTATLLNVRASGLGRFNFTIPAATWTPIDFPDNTEYTLDPSVGTNSVMFWQRETNEEVV